MEINDEIKESIHYRNGVDKMELGKYLEYQQKSMNHRCMDSVKRISISES